jgi:glycosyltransferase involved in cell wall biosynthesis
LKILILHQFYNTPSSGGALRSYYLAKALTEKGMEVVVITTHNQPAVKKTVEEGIEIHYLPVTYNNRYGFFKRIYSFWLFVWSIVRYASRFRDIDLVYAISTPLTTGIAAMWIKFRYSIPYYFEVGDLWPEAPVQMGFVKNPVLKGLLYKLEKMIYSKSDAIVALSPAIKSDIERRTHNKVIHMIPNMADTDFFKPELKRTELEVKYRVSGKLVVSYIGTLGLANGLEYVIDCASRAQQKQQPIHFLICGDGKMQDDLKQMITVNSLTNVSLLGFRDRAGVQEIMNVTDAVLVSYKPLPVLETGSPNKFFDGLAAGKLIVLNVGGWLADLVDKHRCGIACNANDPVDFLIKLKPFIDNPSLLMEYQANARQLAETSFSRKIIGSGFTEIILNR